MKVNTAPHSADPMWSSKSVPLNFLLVEGGKQAPNLQGISIPWHQMTDAKRGFLSPTKTFSLPNKADAVLEPETHSLLPTGPMWGLILPASSGLYHEALFVQN